MNIDQSSLNGFAECLNAVEARFQPRIPHEEIEEMRKFGEKMRRDYMRRVEREMYGDPFIADLYLQGKGSTTEFESRTSGTFGRILLKHSGH